MKSLPLMVMSMLESLRTPPKSTRTAPRSRSRLQAESIRTAASKIPAKFRQFKTDSTAKSNVINAHDGGPLNLKEKPSSPESVSQSEAATDRLTDRLTARRTFTDMRLSCWVERRDDGTFTISEAGKTVGAHEK
jgi:hypothetical protein